MALVKVKVLYQQSISAIVTKHRGVLRCLVPPSGFTMCYTLNVALKFVRSKIFFCVC